MSLVVPTQIAVGALGIGADLAPNTGPEGVSVGEISKLIRS